MISIFYWWKQEKEFKYTSQVLLMIFFLSGKAGLSWIGRGQGHAIFHSGGLTAES